MHIEIKDTYRTVVKPCQGEIHKVKGSKFIGIAIPVETEDDIKSCLSRVKKEFYDARHWCYAWRLGTEIFRFRANDDGEPSNSAGQPIYGQLLSHDVTNVLIVVVRYFGGVKLGVGGLVSAYKIGAQLALESSTIVERIICVQFKLVFDYPHMNKVMRIIKENKLEIVTQKMELNCEYILLVRKSEAAKIHQLYVSLRCLTIKEINI
ncbi:MAG: YigZ family protein [Flavobacteriaceae bacterium]|nr:MAG: YigZ family protein [Flavobacteriaceae bacterium]